MSKKKALERSDTSIIIGIHCIAVINIILSVVANYWVGKSEGPAVLLFILNVILSIIAILGQILILITQPKWHKLLAILLILLNLAIGAWSMLAWAVLTMTNPLG